MKNNYLYILILTAIISTAAVATASAQGDTLSGIPLYQNAVSTDAPPADNHSVIHVGTGNAMMGDDDLRTFYNYYAAGKYREALALSKGINTSKFSKTQNEVYYKYAIAAYKEMEYNEEADSVMQLFRQKYPFYKPNNYDPASFREIFDNYYTMPKFSLWVATASPMVQTIIDTVYVITIDTLQRKPDYSYDAKAVQLGFEYHPLKFLSVSFAPTMLFYSCNRSSKRHEFATYHYKKRYMTLCLPLRVEAGLYRKREFFVPSVFIGAQTKYALRSQYTSYIDVIGQVTEVPDEQSDLDSKTRLNYSLFGGVRFSFNCNRRFTYFAEASASADMLPVNNPDKKYASRDALYRDLYINDAYRLRELSLMVGVKVNLKYKTVAKNGYGYVKK